MITVGIGGASRSGKDTVAAFAIQYVGGRTIAFADAMKKLIGPVFEWNAEVLYGPSERRNQVDYRFGSTDARVKVWRRFDEVVESWLKQHLPTGISHDAASLKLHGWLSNVLHASEITPRRVLQMLGDAGRSLRPSFWIDVTFDEL
ncbi:MAG TPA: hypothetical protein VGE37_12080, partial [Archangium sp.]